MKYPSVKTTMALLLTIMVLMLATPSIADTVDKMTKEELLEILDSNTVSIIDVRREHDWDSSEFKIKGAVRIDPEQFSSQAKKLSRVRALVLYCA